MIGILALIAWAIAVTQLLAALPFTIEVLAGLPSSRRRTAQVGAIPETVVLMPAHDEARQIGGILSALFADLPPPMRVLVVADNCTDDTAALARAAGAEVVERHDPARHGKGYALAFGRDHLRARPPEVVIVLDADCRAEPGSLGRLAMMAAEQGAAVQGLYLLEPRTDAAPMVQISSFAFLVKNLVRQRGLQRIGAPIPLGGTGMAFPWPMFRDAALASGHLVEDLALSVDLAQAGHPARFEEDAAVWSDAASQEATLGQRARWEGGFLQVARTHGLRLVGEGLRRGRPGLMWMGLHVMTPPLALLVSIEAALLALAVPFWIARELLGDVDPFAPLALSIAVILLIALLVLAAWALHGQRWLRPGTLLRLPLYLMWKMALYLRLARGQGPRGWVRTEREG